MHRLIQFLYRYRAFILFLMLEGLSFWIVVENNAYQSAKFFTASAGLASSVHTAKDDVSTYFDLVENNKALAAENARLRQYLLSLQDTDSTLVQQLAEDSTIIGAVRAKVIDNSLFFKSNYLMINKGVSDGISQGMGVVGPDGIIGHVRSVSSDYAIVNSVLHDQTLVSSIHKPSGALCSTVWNGEDPLFAQVEYLPKHINIQPGDTVTTSGFNSIFPENYQIGIVEEVSIGDEATFYDVKIRLSTDYYKLSHVYLLSLPDKPQIDSLRTVVKEELDG